MAVQTIKIVEGNTAPPYLITAQRNGVVLDLTGCTVALVIWNGTTVTNTGHQTCTINSPATAGIVQYIAHATDFSTSGSYTCDLVVTYSDTTVETLYDQIKFVARLKVNSTT